VLSLAQTPATQCAKQYVQVLTTLNAKGVGPMNKGRLAIQLLLAGFLVFGALETVAVAQPGARCPNGYTANFDRGVLRCRRTRTDRADVACPPQNAVLNVELVVTTGRDRCKVPGTPVSNNLPNAGCFALPFDNTGWRVQVDAGNTIRDRCVRTRTEFAAPVLF
jgi:hypothetical protein